MAKTKKVSEPTKAELYEQQVRDLCDQFTSELEKSLHLPFDVRPVVLPAPKQEPTRLKELLRFNLVRGQEVLFTVDAVYEDLLVFTKGFVLIASTVGRAETLHIQEVKPKEEKIVPEMAPIEVRGHGY